MNSLPRTVTRQRRGCDLNPGRTAPESSTLTTRQQHVKCACENKVNDGNPHAEIMCAGIANHWMLSVLKCVAV